MPSPPQIQTVWRGQSAPKGAYVVVIEVDLLDATDDRFLIYVEVFDKNDAPIDRNWYKDSVFFSNFRRMWTRYDMIRCDAVLGDVDD